MAITPKQGLAGVVVTWQAAPGTPHWYPRAGQISGVTANPDGTWNAKWLGADHETACVFVDVGGVTPAAPTAYFQAIDATS